MAILEQRFRRWSDIFSTSKYPILVPRALFSQPGRILSTVSKISHDESASPESVIFTVVELALRQNGIRSLRIDQKLKNDPAPHIFRSDPDILVLLLHGFVHPLFFILIGLLILEFHDRERENAGLNVTCASRVFLLESVVHHSFEVQGTAISVYLHAFMLTHLKSYRPYRPSRPTSRNGRSVILYPPAE